MSPRKAGEQAISDAAVKAKTGKGWKSWFSILDRWNAGEKGHTATAKHLHEKHGVSSWWSQAITVRHEQDRGLRKVGERAGGSFEVSVQRTMQASPTEAFAAFTQANHLNRWFTTKARVNLKVGGKYSNADRDRGTYLAVKPPRMVRFTWDNEKHCPDTTVEVTFTPPSRGKVAVRVQHAKIGTKKDREDMKEGWSWALDSLKSYLEKGKPVTFEAWKEAQKAARRGA